jgi:DNA-binding PadR family transcriptional regulator
MPVKSSTRYAVLGLLTIKPMSAYELVRFSKDSIGFFWNESYGNIHRMLKKLADEGMIYLLADTKSGRRKKTYTITEKGRQQLKIWLCKPPDEDILRDELLLKIFMAEEEDLPEIRSFIQREQAELEQVLIALYEVQQGVEALDQDPTRKVFWLLTLDYGKRYARTRQLWCQEAIKKLEQIERNKKL